MARGPASAFGWRWGWPQVCFALLAAAGAVEAQEPTAPAPTRAAPRLEVSLTPDTGALGRVPVVRLRHLLADDRWIDALRSGFPLRLHYRLELWRARGGWFDAFERQVEWDVVVRPEPLLDQYTVSTVLRGSARERRYPTLDALEAALGFAYLIPIRPPDRADYYYLVSLQVSTLSDSDLDELERFLRGDLGPAASGSTGLGDVVGRGAKRLLLRIAGLPTLRLEGRSEKFRP